MAELHWRVMRIWSDVLAERATEAIAITKKRPHDTVDVTVIASPSEPKALPWAGWFDIRCKARTEDRGAWSGRCELKRHGSDMDHALERGMDIPRWSTVWTG